ncbi:NPCBM/NEW2 domain-containing protein [Arthrobacter psychrolactophilus]
MGPFVKGNAGGVTDPRTHLAPIHAPFTQKGWNGKVMDDVLDGNFSLHAHEENGGLVYRTTEATMPFVAGHDYEISFNYQSTKANEYAWVGGYDGSAGAVQTQSTPLPAMHDTSRWVQNFTASACGESYVGLLRTGSTAADLSLDNLLIRDLGESTTTPACAQLNLAQTGPIIEQNTENEFTTTLVSNEPAPVSNAAVTLALPEGWSATATTPATAATLAPGATLVTKWNVFAPASADGSYNITATSKYTTTVAPIGERSATSTAGVYTMPHPPTTDTFASDMQWIGTPTNGWVPPRTDLTNGEQGEKDGPAIMLDGKPYAKGLGVHAASNVKYFVGTQCSTFTAVIGIDDFQSTKGSVIFKVLGDGAELFNSGVLTGSSAALPISVDLKGAKYVELVVDPNGSNGNDWADWADAKFLCSDEAPAAELAPVVNPGGLLERGKSYTVTVGELKAGSEAVFSLGTAELGKAVANDAGVAEFNYTVAADAAEGVARINVAGTDNQGKAATGSVAITIVGDLPDAPTKDVFASDLAFVGTAVNEWGPVELDQNNGEEAQEDGAPLTLDGKVYAKGLGVHADSSVRFFLGGQCTSFSAVVGIDDAKLSKAHRGNVVFTVVGDGKTLATSPQLTVDSDAYTLTADVTGIRFLDLNAAKVAVAGLNGDEWADWADAKFSCADQTPAVTLLPVVDGGNAVEQGSTHTVNVAELQAGSTATLQLADGGELTATANAAGVATFTLVIPEDATVGTATLTAAGTDKSGKAATGTITISVTAKPAGPSEPGFTPEAANLKSLKKDTAIDLGLGSKKFQRGPSEVTLANLAAGKWFYVYLNGDGLGWHQVLPDGTIQVNTPESTSPGENKVVLFNEAGSLHGWTALKVTGPPVK